MHSLSNFCPKGASLITSHISSCSSSNSSRRRKFFAFDSAELRNIILSRSSNIFSKKCSLKCKFYELRRSCHGKSFALALALDREPVEHEQVEELTPKSESNELNSSSVNGVSDNELVGSEENCKVDVRELAHSLHDAKTVDDVDELLKNFDNLPLRVYSSMIRGFGLDSRLDSAFALFEWLKKKSNDDSNRSLAPNLYIYNSLLGAVKQTEQFERFDEVMDDMKLQGVVPNIVTYNTLMSVYIEQGKPMEALGVLVDIEKNGLLPSPVTYSTALRAYRKMNDADGAIEFFVKIRENYKKGEVGKDTGEDWEIEFVKLEKFTIRLCYLVMRQWLVSACDLTGKVLKLLGDIDKVGLKPEREVYERLAWACTRDVHYTVAKELYGRIRENEGEISLSVCNHIIWVLGKAKKWWTALEIYENLLDNGLKPNNLTNELIVSHFNVLLSAARKRGIWRWGIRLLNKMQEKGFKISTREWNAVLIACSKASETSAAVEIFRRMIEQGEKPTVLSYGALLSALGKGKLYDEALKVWDHMCKVGIKPNLHAYTILASVYIGKGEHEQVDYLLREMVSAGIKPTVVTYNAIITGFTKKNLSSAAFEWFHRMKVQNVIPNETTYEMLINALVRDGKPRLAYEMYSRALNQGLQLSSKSYDTVLESCRNYGATIDLSALGPRPPETNKTVKIRRSKPFEKTELYTSKMHER